MPNQSHFYTVILTATPQIGEPIRPPKGRHDTLAEAIAEARKFIPDFPDLDEAHPDFARLDPLAQKESADRRFTIRVQRRSTTAE